MKQQFAIAERTIKMVVTIKKHFCDRCKKEFNPTDLPIVTNMSFDYTVQTMCSTVSDRKKDYELCPECADEFIRWKNQIVPDIKKESAD